MSVEVVKWSRIQLGGKVQVAFTLPPAMVGRSIGAPRTLRVVQGLGVWVVEDAEWLALVLEVKRHQHALFAFERDAALGRVVVAYEKNLDASRKCDKCQRFSISQCPQHKPPLPVRAGAGRAAATSEPRTRVPGLRGVRVGDARVRWRPVVRPGAPSRALE
jgi:hypothetical protein